MIQKAIQTLYKKFQVPQHIIRHMQVVSTVASKLADQFLAKGFKIDKQAVVQAALVHDILRIHNCGKLGHEKAAAKILRKQGENKIAGIVSRHGFASIDKLKTLEEKILYYADKRVNHDKIVSLKKRFSEGRKRNLKPTDNLAKIKMIEQKIKLLERELETLLKSKLRGLTTF